MKREIVLPATLLESGEDFKPSLTTYKIGNNVYSGILGLYERGSSNEVNVIPLRGKYYPNVGDRVIGIVTKLQVFSWNVDINSFHEAVLPFSNAIKKGRTFYSDLSKLISINDVIYAEIVSYDRFSPPTLSLRKKGLGKITEGYLYEISPGKIPRVIGKNRSMINMLKQMLGIRIIVGKNGRIVALTQDYEKIAILGEIIEKIETESHVPGLTDRVKNLLESKLIKTS
ncbi:MAG: exosome complex RNA-binding protein Rrp4 [Thermoproteota archaeon]|jgi:RNA-binding protein Rrp4 and related proteins (contain S1 domain and KH domain)